MIWQNWASGAVVALAAALGIDSLAVEPAAHPPALKTVAVSTTPEPLSREDLALATIGKLRFLGAVQLRSSDPDFGGISALRAGPDSEFIGVTDAGNWISFRTIEAGGRLAGIEAVRIAAILGNDGRPAATKADGDAEALEWDPATGVATVVYEQDHRLAHFAAIDADRLSAAPTRIERMTPMAGWPPNGGGEALALLRDGTRIVISERRTRPDGSHVALLTRGGTTREIGITGIADHSPTDAVALDATRILVLQRRYDLSGQGAALSLVDLAPALGGGTDALPATLLARWQAPLLLDNMEGLAIRRDGDRIFLYLVSDDNFSSLQRTLLMKFELIL